MIKISNNIKAILFDCDGTLADTMPIHLNAWAETFRLEGRECPMEFFDSRKGAPAEKIVAEYNEKFNDNLNPDEFSDKKDIITLKKLKHAKPIDFVAELALKYKGKMPMAVVSGGKKNNVMTTLNALGFDNHFDTVITNDDGFKSKPAPDMFLEAANRLDVPAENCLVLEDGDFGIIAAKNANMEFIDVRDYLDSKE